MRHISTLLVALLLLPLFASAENSTRAPGYTVHHNAIPTAMLTPAIASSYSIIRSKYRGLLNVSIIRTLEGTTGQPVKGQVKVVATNLLDQSRTIAMREIKEEEAIYYIGEFPIINRETLTFRMEVIPEGTDNTIRAALSQQFFID
ncbi:MAG: DUF4426 domain-containing protein [Gammaproteobacteria bacterium]|nr:DUF4426 domain-containing protein [Gammaproteobacteria bacterium]